MKAKGQEKLVKDIKQRKTLLHELEDVMSADPLTEQQVNSLVHETTALQQAVDQLRTTRDNLIATADGQIGFYRDRVKQMEKKKDTLADHLTELEDDRKDAENDLRQLEADLNSLAVGGEMPRTDSQM